MSNTSDLSEQQTAAPAPWLTSAGAQRSRPLPSPPAQAAGAIAGQVSEHLVRHLRRQARRQIGVVPTSARAAAPEHLASSASALSSAAVPGSTAALRPPEHVLSSTTLLSAWLASTHTTWSEDELRRLLADQEQPAAATTGPAFALFMLGGHRWGVPLECLREVLPTLPPLTPLPFSPLWLLGVINVRSEPVGVVNVSELLLDPISASNTLRRSGARPVLIAESDGIPLALLVEEVNETLFPEESQLQPPNAAETRWLPALAAAHLQAVWTSPETQEPIFLLDLHRLLAMLLQEGTSREVADG